MEKFNSYLTNIDAGLIKEICTSRGKPVHFKKNEYFVRADESSLYIGFVVKGVFCYRCTNGAEGKAYNVGFAFSDEFIADYPACLYGLPSEMDIQALTANFFTLSRYLSQDPGGTVQGVAAKMPGTAASIASERSGFVPADNAYHHEQHKAEDYFRGLKFSK